MPHTQVPRADPPGSLTDLVHDDYSVRRLTLFEGLSILGHRPPAAEPFYARWPTDRSNTRPAPRCERLGPPDRAASISTAYDLPTFSTRLCVPAAADELALALLPSSNAPPTTAPQQRTCVPPAPANAAVLFASPEWAAALNFAQALDRNLRHYRPDSDSRHRRRTKDAFEVPEGRALALTDGRVLDLRDAIAGDVLHPERARTLGSARPASNLNIALIRQWATESAFPDVGILDELEFGMLNRSTTPRKTRIAGAHRGAFTYSENIDAVLEGEAGKSPPWFDGPYRYAPVWPCRAVETNVVVQRRPDKLKLRITTDFSESGTDEAIKAGIDLAAESPHINGSFAGNSDSVTGSPSPCATGPSGDSSSSGRTRRPSRGS